MWQELWCMDHLSQLCEKINNDWISFVNCKGHDFNLGLSNIEFHCQLEKTLLSIQIPCWNNGSLMNHGNIFPLLRLWTKGVIESREDLQMMRKCHLYICLHLVLGITIPMISKINCSRNQTFNSLVNLSTLPQPFNKQVSSVQGCIKKKKINQRGKVHTYTSRSFASLNKYNTSLSQTQNHTYQLQNGNIIPTLKYI
jgi:hypothetical protein